VRDDLTPEQIVALRKLGWQTPAEKRRARRDDFIWATGKWVAIIVGAILALKACQFTEGYRYGSSDDGDAACGHRGCE